MGVDQVHSLQKIPTRHHGTNFGTSSVLFAPSFVRHPNGPQCTQIVRNTPKCQLRVHWGGSGAFVVKNSDATSWNELLHQLARFELSVVTQETVPNAPKNYEMHQNMSLWSNGMDRVPWLWKIPTRLRCTTFALIAPVQPDLHRVSYSHKMVAKTPKH